MTPSPSPSQDRWEFSQLRHQRVRPLVLELLDKITDERGCFLLCDVQYPQGVLREDVFAVVTLLVASGHLSGRVCRGYYIYRWVLDVEREAHTKEKEAREKLAHWYIDDVWPNGNHLHH